MWGTFSIGVGRERKTHVVPCDEKGLAAKGHVLTMECPCHPRIEPESPWIVIHEEIN